jgi:cation/acetate symporter
MGQFNKGVAADLSAGLFTVAFVLALVVMGLLGHYGLPDSALGIFLAGGLVATYMAAAFVTRTMDATTFFVANRSVSAAANGMSTAAIFLSGNIFFGLAGAYYADVAAALALTLGWSFGFVLLAVLIAPYFRRSGAFGVAGFLAICYGGRSIRLAAVIMIALVLIGALAATFATAAWIGKVHLGLSEPMTLGALIVITAVMTMLGGMRSLSVVSVLQYIALAAAFLIPAILVSATRFSIPIPQFAFGLALQEAAEIAARTGHELADAITGRLQPGSTPGTFGFMATVATLAAGVAVLPHITMRSATLVNPDIARRSAAWSLAFILVVLITAPVYAAFARVGLMSVIEGATVSSLPQWIYEYGREGLIQICNGAAESRFTVANACREAGGFTGSLSAADFALATDAVMLVWPSIMGLPHIVTVMLAVGALSAIIATAGAIALAIANSVGHDLFGRIITSRSSAGRRLIATRLALIAALIIAAWIASRWPDSVLSLATCAVSLSAAGLFPAMVLAVWWRRANLPGAITGMIAGFTVTLIIHLQHYGVEIVPIPLPDFSQIGITATSSGLIGALVGFAVIALVSLMTSPPSVARLAIMDTIRRPGDTPIIADERD